MAGWNGNNDGNDNGNNVSGATGAAQISVWYLLNPKGPCP